MLRLLPQALIWCEVMGGCRIKFGTITQTRSLRVLRLLPQAFIWCGVRVVSGVVLEDLAAELGAVDVQIYLGC